ncbi:hypothetical protein F5148DRAFT_1213046 [Russula earlei]|uniref:Uncharacterized protein n=1 Tax=Russula earlei TaxID=71964 RepID=A0ACC0U612_9AGAM|nr:hypothetical protein F5148DRAFT_1213046 [Russula earlei]
MTCLAFAAAHPLEDISSSVRRLNPRLRHLMLLIHSPWPTDPHRQVPLIPTQDVIFVLFGTPPSRASSVVSLHLQDEDSSGKRKINERPQTHAYHAKIHELEGVMLRPLPRVLHSCSPSAILSLCTFCSTNISIIYTVNTSSSQTCPALCVSVTNPSAVSSVFLPSNDTSPATYALVTWDSTAKCREEG